MAIELVDGHAGRAHVGSDDLAVLNAATYGVADCVFDVGERLRCTMDTANRALIASGAGMVGGRRWRVDGQESLSVESGTQGQRRNDLVVARYGNDGGVESVHLEVVRGESGPDGPQDPAVGRDGLALWRIPIDGINAGEPQRMFRVADTVSSLRRGIDRAMGTDENPPADWNAAKSGAYVVGSIGTHGPAGVYQWGYLVVHRMDAGACLQFYVTDKVTNVYARSQYGGSWSGWEHVYDKYGRSIEAR